jgi:hypothetical protein
MPTAVEVTLDDQWFLAVPAEPDVDSWVARSVADLLIEPGRESDPGAVADDLRGFAELADPDAVANLLFCPDGLPGRAIVSIYAAPTDLASLDDLLDEAVASLPRQVLPFGDVDAARARIISTVQQLPEGGVLGILQMQRLVDGHLIEAIVASPSLRHLGAGIPLFTELASRVALVEVAQPEGSLHGQSA